LNRAGWIVRRFILSPLRTVVEVITGIGFYFYVAVSLGVSGAVLASTDRSANRVVQLGWFAFELLRYAGLCVILWFLSAIYFTLFDREIFLTAWRDTYRPWFQRGATDALR
jgi:hypothetical protein